VPLAYRSVQRPQTLWRCRTRGGIGLGAAAPSMDMMYCPKCQEVPRLLQCASRIFHLRLRYPDHRSRARVRVGRTAPLREPARLRPYVSMAKVFVMNQFLMKF